LSDNIRAGYLLVIALLLAPVILSAQQFALPMNNISRMRMERAGVQLQPRLHYGAFPALTSYADLSDVVGLGPDTTAYYYKVTAKLFSEHLIEFERPGLILEIDPIFDFTYGNEVVNQISTLQNRQNLYTNTRGFAISAKVGNVVYIYTDFQETQARVPGYVDRFVDSLGVIPGNGRVKPFAEDAFDYNMANGFVGISPTKWLSFQAGHFKQFVGHGHRSLLLSDNAFNYPFAKYIIQLWEGKVQYQYSIGLHQNLRRLPQGDAPESLFQRKYMSWNYLSYKPIPSVEIGFFESVMWKSYDVVEGTQPFNPNALNPLIFVNTGVLGLSDSDNNAMVGVNFAWQLLEKLRFYAQYMRDGNEPLTDGYQLGAKYYRFLNRIDFGLEYNEAAPLAYISENSLQGYSHNNQPMAHPLGAGFKEWIGTVTYLHKRIYARGEFMTARLNRTGRDPLLTSANQSVRGAETQVQFIDLQLAYIFNPSTNMQVYGGFTDRNEQYLGDNLQNQFWYLGLRTYLHNSYRNF